MKLKIRSSLENKTGYRRIQIFYNYRENGKSKKKVLKHVGIAKNNDEFKFLYNLALNQIESEIEKLYKTKLITKSTYQSNTTSKNFTAKINLNCVQEVSRITCGPQIFYGKLFHEHSFNKILSSKKYAQVLEQLVIQRIVEPASKLKTQKNLALKFNEQIPLKDIYKTISLLGENGAPRGA